MFKLCCAASMWFAMAACCVAASPGTGQAEADGQLEREIDRLAQQLIADRAADREAAEARLLDLAGSPAVDVDRILELIPAESDQMPVALRESLTRIRQSIEERAAKAAIEGSKVTLSAQKQPLAEVFAAIEKQTENRFVDDREPGASGDPLESNITIELDDEPFWPAVDRILDQAHGSVYAYGGEGALSIVSRPRDDTPRYGRAKYHGPFRIELLQIQADRNLRSGFDSLKLQLEVAWEPRLRPIAIAQSVAEVEAQIDSGKRLAVSEPQAVIDVEISSDTQAAEIVLPFRLPSRESHRITMLRGRMTALVPGRRVKFRFGDLENAAGQTQRLGGVQVTFDQLRRNNDLWEIHMRLTLDESNKALRSHRGWVFQNPSYLLPKDGESIDNVGMETTSQMPNEVGVVYFFDLSGGLDGLTWVYETPAAIVELPVEYELLGIELP